MENTAYKKMQKKQFQKPKMNKKSINVWHFSNLSNEYFQIIKK